MDGLWEAGVKSFKQNFKNLALSLKYLFEKRPLCLLANNADWFDALKPGHFLIGGPLFGNCRSLAFNNRSMAES